MKISVKKNLMDSEIKKEIDGFFKELLIKWELGYSKSLQDLLNIEINKSTVKDRFDIGTEEENYFKSKTQKFIDSAILGKSGIEKI